MMQTTLALRASLSPPKSNKHTAYQNQVILFAGPTFLLHSCCPNNFDLQDESSNSETDKLLLSVDKYFVHIQNSQGP